MPTNTPQADPVADELKSCPFCGSTAIIGCVTSGPSDALMVACGFCYTRGPRKPSEAEAIEAWNTRTIPPTAASSEPTVIIRAARCGHHHNDDCTGCARSLEMNDNLLDELREEVATLEIRIAHMTDAAGKMATAQCQGSPPNVRAYFMEGVRRVTQCPYPAKWIVRVNPPREGSDGCVRLCQRCNQFEYLDFSDRRELEKEKQ